VRFSRRTLVALACVLEGQHTHTGIDMLAYELRLEKAAVGANKLARSLALLQALEQRCEEARDDRPVMELLQDTLRS
jgi:hypothetical protein